MFGPCLCLRLAARPLPIDVYNLLIGSQQNLTQIATGPGWGDGGWGAKTTDRNFLRKGNGSTDPQCLSSKCRSEIITASSKYIFMFEHGEMVVPDRLHFSGVRIGIALS